MSMVKNSGYQQCSKCVMDTSDPLITFDGDGVCNHCSHFAAVTAQQWNSGQMERHISISILSKRNAKRTRRNMTASSDLVVAQTALTWR